MDTRIGVLGGSFDPIHHGHLAIAHEVAWAQGLERVLLVPAAQQPLKYQGHGANAQQRLAMVELACATDPLLEPCDLEIQRAGPSYTIDTLHDLLSQLGSTTRLFFILGADALGEMPRWHRAAELIALCHFVVVDRPGIEVNLATLEPLLPGLGKRLVRVVGPGLQISGTELRRRIGAGQPVRYQLPDSVLAYIQQHGLYQ